MAEVLITCKHDELDRCVQVLVDDDQNPIGPRELVSRCSCGNEVRTETDDTRPWEHDSHLSRHVALPAVIVVVRGRTHGRS